MWHPPELLLIQSKYMHLEPFPPLKICNDLVHTGKSLSARNLGIFFMSLAMEKQVSGFFHLRNIAKSKCYLSEKSLLIVVAHAVITNKMDYCILLLFGLPNTLLYKLQCLQNSTAKLKTGKQKYDHNTQLIKLHWLPVKERIYFKILLITFKCLNNLESKYLSDLISIHKPTRHLRSADSVLLDMPRIEHVTYGGRAFSRATPFL